MIFKKKPGLSTNNNKQNYIYVENLVHAILKLEEKLVPQSTVQGKVELSRPFSFSSFFS